MKKDKEKKIREEIETATYLANEAFDKTTELEKECLSIREEINHTLKNITCGTLIGIMFSLLVHEVYPKRKNCKSKG